MNYVVPRLVVLALAVLTQFTSPAQSLKVTLLGTGAPIPRLDRFGPSILVEAGPAKLLFDCGRGATQRLWQLKIPLGTIQTVFFTHLHSDHVVGFPDLWLTGWLPTPFGGRSVPLRVIGPAGTVAMTDALRQAYAWDTSVRPTENLPAPGISLAAKDIKEGVVYDQDGVKVTAFDVAHGPHLTPALGYRIEYAGRSVLLSGDTGFSENLIRFGKGVDVVVHEVAAATEELLQQSKTAGQILSYHTQPEEAGKVFSRLTPRLAVYSHVVLLSTVPNLPPPGADVLIPRTRKTYTGPLELGEDLMTIEIGTSITVKRFVPPGKG
ncbi:MBL fold metallo-hydrolase [Hymenobacter chitinivorans]|uniref:Ribonuclease Z n=1 Tax=Hymenobacter chitinivorans DSM 11115 TaxID=1121954 RepID=A0A2M9BPE5_9BACT|nr:MBL fold metallo-hydrolase [Hymenobacter chitinivorans]PJJ59800.1 ribonuclease Z [Hymenobacter chitinivorans DSM 11115]